MTAGSLLRFASFRSINLQVLLLVVLLVAELECLLVSNYPIRTELRALFGIPVYHVLLTFLTLICLLRWLTPKVFSLPPAARFSWRWLAVHLAIYLGIWSKLQVLWSTSRDWPSVALVGFWCCLGGALLVTWLLAWLPLGHWKDLWGRVKGWVWWVLLLSLVAPYAAELASSAWLSFARLTFALTELALGTLYTDVVVEPHRLLLGTSRFVVEIQPGCSGYEGMGLIAVLLSGYLWLKRAELRFPVALLTLPAGVILAYYANIVRLVVLVALGTEVSPEIAMHGFHSQAGWLSFTLLSLLLIYFIEHSGYLKRGASESEGYSYTALPFLGPMITLLASSMLVKAFSAEFDYLYFLKPLLVGGVLLGLYRGYRHSLVRPKWGLSVTIGLGVYLVWIALAVPSAAASPFEKLTGVSAYLWILFRCLGAVVAVPVAEELAFRGYLLRRLQAQDWETQPSSRLTPLSLGATSVLFGLLHSDLLAGTLAGVAYGWLAARPGYLSNAVVAHAVTNACIAAQVIVRGDWGLW